MLATTNNVAAATTTNPLYLDPPDDHPTLPQPSQGSFKRHKVLPRPRTNTLTSGASSGSLSASHDLPHDHTTETTPKRQSVRLSSTSPDYLTARNTGPDLPPTPPTHSRASSSGSHLTVSPISPVDDSAPSVFAAGSITPVPGTPTLQNSPPTPDVTPPQVARRPKAFRPILTDRIPSKATADSRAESFITARESPGGSDDEKLTPRPIIQRAGTSRRAEGYQVQPRPRNTQDMGSSLGLELNDDLTPKTKKEFLTFDGEWELNGEVEQEWDDNLSRNVTVRKRESHPRATGRTGVIDDAIVTPTKATKALRSVFPQERIYALPSPQPPPESTSRDTPHWTAATSVSSVSTDPRRFSGMSSKSTVSTAVEGTLADAPPQRQKTLRKVRKQTGLRDSLLEISSASSASTSTRQLEQPRRRRTPGKPGASRTDSVVSTGTTNSIASGRARRDVWNNGGIPVVIIPSRKESLKSKRAGSPSLRSNNSRLTKRSNSLGSASRPRFPGPRTTSMSLDRPGRRGRSMTVTYGEFGTDQLTMDYPPIVPRRRSSLSAPTSRNNSRAGSRAGSLTAESLQAHNALLEQCRARLSQVVAERAPLVKKTSYKSDQQSQRRPVLLAETHQSEASIQKSLVDHNGDPFFGKRLTTHNTPFSQASVETSGSHSAADIAEAMAINIYPHQNRSVLMVHHMSKPVNFGNDAQQKSSPGTERSTSMGSRLSNPKIVASGPMTPPQPRFSFSMDDVDSPLRNPRVPPEPPSLKFIPATPSGLTPAAEREKMLGNFFEETRKRPSLVRRALSLRRGSDNVAPRRTGFLTRTLSLPRSAPREITRTEKPAVYQYPNADDPPSDEARLHPFWRPSLDQDMDDNDFVYDIPQESPLDGTYSPFDGRLLPLRRSLSERVRRTFSILPNEDDDRYFVADRHSPERRTIKRTPSGNLRVTSRRGSVSSSRRVRPHLQGEGDERPSTAPDESSRRAWREEKRVDDRGRRLFPNWQDKLEQYRPSSLQRRLSEHRRQKRTEVLRQKISGPREVRDGVGEVIRRNNYGAPSYHSNSQKYSSTIPRSRTYDSTI